jgi:hypothetical protein
MSLCLPALLVAKKCGTENFHGVKHAEYWVKIGASDFVLRTIKEGYIIPFNNQMGEQ